MVKCVLVLIWGTSGDTTLSWRWCTVSSKLKPVSVKHSETLRDLLYATPSQPRIPDKCQSESQTVGLPQIPLPPEVALCAEHSGFM